MIRRVGIPSLFSQVGLAKTSLRFASCYSTTGERLSMIRNAATGVQAIWFPIYCFANSRKMKVVPFGLSTKPKEGKKNKKTEKEH